MRPVADAAEPLELLALHIQPMLGVVAAFGAEGDHRLGIRQIGLRPAPGAIILLLDLPLDGQAMTVPAGNVIRVLARHLLAADDHVLQDLVEAGADMDMAVGVRRAVMQQEGLASLGVLAQLSIEAEPLPALEQFRLPLGQPRLHREIGLGQE